MKKHRLNTIHKVLLGTAMAAAPAIGFAGTGPYLGLEAGANWVPNETYTNSVKPGYTQADDIGWMGGLVAGYSFANGLRPEIEFFYRTSSLHAHNGRSSVPGGFVNLWYDFTLPSTWAMPSIHPYVGGGVGFGRINPILSSQFPNNYRSALLYQAGAGIDWDVTDRLTASIGYRWMESSKAAFAGDNTDAAVGRYRAQTALVGVRYSFGEEPVAPVQAPPPPPPPPAAPPPPPPAKPKCNPPAGFKVDENCHIIPQKVTLRSVNFKFDKATLTEPAKRTLDNVAAALKKQPELAVEINGYTDSVGAASYNKRLSQQRADSVRTYLITDGVKGSNLTAKGFGETNPVASNKTRAGRTLNRRVEFRVTNQVEHVKVKSASPTAASVNAAKP